MLKSERGSRSSAIRAHELAKYYRPGPHDDASNIQSQAPTSHQHPNSVSSSQASSPDTALTAYAQLTALRLNASRAMISVIDRETQYFIAESTKTLDLSDTSKSEKEGDGLWLGCASVSAAGRLCEKTVELPVVPNGFPAFIVNDLSQDAHFSQLSFVAGPPYFRYYAGVPLTTNRGINIGSLFIIDDHVRPDLTQEQKVFMTVMSRNVMAYLELGREAEERRRGQTMSHGLARFVEGFWAMGDTVPGIGGVSKGLPSSGSGDQSRESDGNHPMADTPETTPLPAANDVQLREAQSREEHQSDGMNTPSAADTANNNSLSDGSQAGRVQEEKDNGHRATFARAANLLRESLQLDGGSGVVYYDTSIGFGTSGSVAEMSSSGDDEQEGDMKPSPRGYTGTSSPTMYSYSSSTLNRPAAILGFATGTASSCNGNEFTTRLGFSSLSERSLAILLKRYPRGKLWSFDAGTLDSSSEDEPSKYSTVTGNGKGKGKGKGEDRRVRRREAEARLLLAHFPGVRQLLFTPLWDAGSSRWYSGSFCFSFSDLIFSTESELSFSIAFGNCVMAEISRLNTIVSDQSKSDFIGSISHELRSPLHGILASAEFLGETDCDTFQSTLVETIDACGRTLLDTINHVLDFSKINSFEKNWRAAQKGRRGSFGKFISKGQTNSVQPAGPALLNIYAQTDVAAVCEEVVEGVFAGHVYADYSSLDITNVGAGARGRRSNRSTNVNRTLLGGQATSLEPETKEHRVAVIVDIKKSDWIFTTQPGALRRVIMNIFGNALKYTDQGWIRVCLEACEGGENHSNSTSPSSSDANNGMPTKVQLTVTDTGRGISMDYLRTKLYTPFAQENSLAPGTGLGLSIVRSIVNMLGGSIHVRSELGKGTEVRVILPMIKAFRGPDTPVTTPSSISSFDRQQDDSIAVLREQAKGFEVALYGFDTALRKNSSSDGKPVNPDIEKALSTYITEWYGMAVTKLSSLALSADIIIIDEEHLSALRTNHAMAPVPSKTPAIVCLCSNTTRHEQSSSCAGGGRIIEFVSKPFGPYKLAKALRMCLDQINTAKEGTETVQVAAKPTGPTSDMELRGLIPGLERITIGLHEDNNPVEILDNGVVQANEVSVNAQMAVGSACADGQEPLESRVDYPFPNVDSTMLSAHMIRRESERSLSRRNTVPLLPSTDTNNTSAVSKRGTIASTSETSEGHTIDTSENDSKQENNRPPRILLVDDNKINLRLLQTYMRKRHYTMVESADDGGEAVRAFQQSEGFDIIFMDISMPVMNGFEATRAIRHIEAARQTQTETQNDHSHPPSPDGNGNGNGNNRPALIIALTGLASSRDQAEAFTSGVDLFMTKPVAFREVGRLLDNWVGV